MIAPTVPDGAAAHISRGLRPRTPVRHRPT